MDVRLAADLTPEAFHEEYVRKGIPVVIKGDPVSTAAASLGWNPRRMAEECGDMVPNWARTVGAFVDGLDLEQGREWDERLRRVHKSSLAELRETLHGRMTMKEYVQGSHFDGYRLDDFTPAKDFTHPVDYLVPVSIHSVAVADCHALWEDISRQFEEAAAEAAAAAAAESTSTSTSTKTGGKGYFDHPYGNVLYDEDYWKTQDRSGDFDFYLFVGPDKSRAYPTHRHGLPNYNLMLVLSGRKHVVVFPDQETPNLYPFPVTIEPDVNEVGEKPLGYMADPFDPDPTHEKQPDLRKVKRSYEGVAGPGDLIFIPCGVPHAVQNRGEMLAVGWFSSGFAMGGWNRYFENQQEGGVWDDLKCPNQDNAVDYTCKTTTTGEGMKKEMKEKSMKKDGVLYQCDTSPSPAGGYE